MTLNQLIQQWLDTHPNATLKEAIWAGAIIEIKLWCNKKHN